jgi:hypothetical protein
LLFLFRWWRGDAFYTHTFFTNGQRYAQKPLHRAVFIHSYSYTDRLCTQKLLYRRRFTHRFWQKNVQTKNSTHRCFTQRCFFAQPQAPLHTDVFTHKNFYTPIFYTKIRLHSAAFKHRYPYTQMFLNAVIFYTEKPLYRPALHKKNTRKNFDTEKIAHTHNAKYCCTPKPLLAKTLPRTVCTLRNFTHTHRTSYTQQSLHTHLLRNSLSNY